MSLDEIVKALANNTQQFQQETKNSIQNIERQIGQLASSVSKLEAQGSRKLPSQAVMNPRENASAIVLQSGKEVDNQTPYEPTKKKKQGAKESEVPKVEISTEPKLNKVNNSILPPFPCRLAKTKKEEQEKEIWKTFKKVEVNIPLLDAIKQIPRYAKFLKELCTTKRKLRNNEKIRASINVMSNSVFQTLNLGPLKEISVIIQLADRSNAYPFGVVEDVLVQVGGLIFPTDFYILDMRDDSALSSNSAFILFGRPFLKTAKTKIDVDEGTLTIEFDGETVKFNIFDAMKYPVDDHSVFSIDVVNTFVHDVFELSMEDELERISQLHELEEICLKAYENSRIYKEKTKAFHDKLRKQFLMPGKLCSHWIGPFVVTNMFPYGAVQIQSLGTNKVFKVNSHELKPFYEGFQEHSVEELNLSDPIYLD
ncbi:hypothetical protein P3X46_000445 [Hevea brasiliensis]|uniref:Uncharacterized protein n=1 Tax=Hevea brasiliensis TaxID=3981 RepID=A0ABQ9NE45_HEVBR|nr:hypothetical protein P3X46_000445 [Hevea brasiliensis]